jgi:hypothetical protein
MEKIAEKGWIFEVENPEGNLLYMVAHPDPIEAEDLLRDKINLDDKFDIYMFRAASRESLENFNLAEGDIKGPM